MAEHYMQCCVRSCFLSIHGLPDGRAQRIIRAWKDYCNRCDVACFGSDGVSAMLGKYNDMATKPKEGNLCMLSIHCINHPLAQVGTKYAQTMKFHAYIRMETKRFDCKRRISFEGPVAVQLDFLHDEL